MPCFIAGTLPAGRHRWSAIVIALCLTLVSVVAFGSIAASARAAEDPLLAQVPVGSCPNDTAMPNNDIGRRALTCLINKVRVNAKLRQLTFCDAPGGPDQHQFCHNNTGLPWSSIGWAQVNGLNIAAQFKSQDVQWCTSGTVFRVGEDPAHGACGRDIDFWPRNPCIGINAIYPCSPFITATWNPGIHENLAAGYPYATPRTVVDMWLKSPGHRTNMLGDRWWMGVGFTPGPTHGLMLVPVGSVAADGHVVKLGEPGTRVGDAGMFWTAQFS
jgi:hypothetical protein